MTQLWMNLNRAPPQGALKVVYAFFVGAPAVFQLVN